ncbi:MAG: Crp/Fnr family transcriptional regulator [Bacteroidales bacterium]|nr:Crp/Fnr family transcriptional regulator [Bacteroidales bacterium]
MNVMEKVSEDILSILTECSLFNGLNQDELSEILSGISNQVRTYAKGDLIALAGDEVFFLHIIFRGSVRGEMVDFAGKVIKIEDIIPPRPLAPAFVFGKQNRYPVNIIANDHVEIISIPRDSFLMMMQSSELILRNFVDNVSSRGQFLSNKIKFLSFSTIKGKLAQYLLDLSGKVDSDRLTLPFSQSQLSELFGVTRPSVGRAISEMNQDGIIRSEGKEVILLDKSRLSALLK